MQEKESNIEKDESRAEGVSVEGQTEGIEIGREGKESSGEIESQAEDVERVEEKYGQIEVSKIEAKEFFAAKEYAEKLKELTKEEYFPEVAILLFDTSSREARKVMKGLDKGMGEGKTFLSFQARWYIREEAKKQGRDSEGEELEDKQKMFLSGKEVEQFLQYQKMGYLIKELGKETKELLEHDKNGASKVLTLVSQTEDLQDVRKYLKEHKRELSRQARDFLKACIIVKEKMRETLQEKNIFRPR